MAFHLWIALLYLQHSHFLIPHGHPLKNQRTEFPNFPHIQDAKIGLNFQLVFTLTWDMNSEEGKKTGRHSACQRTRERESFQRQWRQMSQKGHASDPRTRDPSVARPVGQFRNCLSLDSFQLVLVSSWGSVQFSHSVMSNSLWPHGLQHTRLACPSPTPGVYSNSCPLSWWCHPTILSSVIPFSSCLQPFPAWGSFPPSQFFTSGGQSIGDHVY